MSKKTTVEAIYGEIVRLEFDNEDTPELSVMHISYDKNIRLGRADVVVLKRDHYEEITAAKQCLLDALKRVKEMHNSEARFKIGINMVIDEAIAEAERA